MSPVEKPTQAEAGWRLDLDAAPRDGTRIDLWAIYSVQNPPKSEGRRHANCQWVKDWQGEGWRDTGGGLLEWQEADDEQGLAERRAVAWRAIDAPDFARLAADQAARTTTTEGVGGKWSHDRGCCYNFSDPRCKCKGLATPPATPAGGGETLPHAAFPRRIGRVSLGERPAPGDRLCSHGHDVPAGHPLYWPDRGGEYPDDIDPLCLAHAIEQAESDSGWCDCSIRDALAEDNESSPDAAPARESGE